MTWRYALNCGRRAVPIALRPGKGSLPGSEAAGMTWKRLARQLWPLVERHLPAQDGDRARGGRPPVADQLVFEKLVLFLRAGCSWETFDELCRGSGVSGRTVRRRLAVWRDTGVFERVLAELCPPAQEAPIAHLDATFVRSRGGGGDLVGLTRHGKGSKVQVLVDERSLPLAFQLASANPNESTITEALLEATDGLPGIVVGDKAYDYDFLRDAFAERGSKLVAPHRSDRKRPARDQEQIGRHYRRRWVVERLFAWLAAWRRLATRWERRAEHYRQLLCLGLSLICVRRLCP